MRLININTLELEFFVDETCAPPYAILSHTWGRDEVTFQDVYFRQGELYERQGWKKITQFCSAVMTHRHLLSKNVQHVWVDTCCIDKTNSSELSEAINSMFRWYRDSVACFVVLQDVEAQEQQVDEAFEKSRWFTRGWTLQELLAPHLLYFFDKRWSYIDSKNNLAERISKCTRIDVKAIHTNAWRCHSVAQKMSWAAERETTRREDIAYCLMGIFDVILVPVYGEGNKAFVRLQEAIMKETDDQSIFAWDASEKARSILPGALATKPSQFRNCANVMAFPAEGDAARVTPKGINIQLPIVVKRVSGRNIQIAILSCTYGNDPTKRIAIPVSKSIRSKTQYLRRRAQPIQLDAPVIDVDDIPAIYLVKCDQVIPAEARVNDTPYQIQETIKLDEANNKSSQDTAPDSKNIHLAEPVQVGPVMIAGPYTSKAENELGLDPYASDSDSGFSDAIQANDPSAFDHKFAPEDLTSGSNSRFHERGTLQSYSDELPSQPKSPSRHKISLSWAKSWIRSNGDLDRNLWVLSLFFVTLTQPLGAFGILLCFIFSVLVRITT